VGYLAQFRVVDALCLNLREMPRPPLDRDPEAFARFVFARRPAALVVPSARADRFLPLPEYGVYPALARQPSFASDYAPAGVFFRPGEAFGYWVFERRPAGAGTGTVTDTGPVAPSGRGGES
jgi:hypothetical protein